MGPPKAVALPRTEPIVAPLPPTDSIPGDAKDKARKETASGEETPDAAPTTEVASTQTTTTTSPFLDWVRRNQDAAELARAQREKYKSAAGVSDTAEDDLMLNIRYPYTWNQQQPPGSSAVIYSVPKR
jgi:hypothetical protein